MADEKKKPALSLGLAIAFGMLGGAIVGMLFLDNIAIGTAFGLSFGIIFGVIFGPVAKD